MNLLRLFRRINDDGDKKIQRIRKPAVWEFPKKKERDSDGYYPIVCPHCMNQFHIWEVEFRSVESYLENNNKDNENTIGFSLEIDEKYDRYEARIGNHVGVPRGKVLKIFDEKGEPTGEVTHITLMDKQNGGTDINGTRIPIMERNARDFIKEPIMAVINKYGELCLEKICPYCHHQVSDYVGIMPSYNIAFIGDINVGKGDYLYRLEARMFDSGLLGGSLIGHESNPCYKSRIRFEMEIGQTAGQNRPRWTFRLIDYNTPTTIIFHKNQEQEGFILNLFSFDGSIIGRPEPRFYLRREISQIYKNLMGKMDAFMIMFDATVFETVRAVFERDEKLKSYINKNSNPIVFLNHFENEYLIEQSNRITQPAAFIMSKSDLIKSAKAKNSDYFQNLTDREIFLNPNPKQDQDRTKVDLDDLYECDRAIERFLEESHTDSILYKRAKIDQKNGEACWFAVSSKGDAANGGAEPVRITEPMEWVLWRLGLVQGEGNAIPGGGNPIRVK